MAFILCLNLTIKNSSELGAGRLQYNQKIVVDPLRVQKARGFKHFVKDTLKNGCAQLELRCCPYNSMKILDFPDFPHLLVNIMNILMRGCIIDVDIVPLRQFCAGVFCGKIDPTRLLLESLTRRPE